MFCGECGTRNPDTNQFCRNCGKPLKRPQPVTQPAAQPSVRPVATPAAVPATPAPALVTPPEPARPAGKRKRNWTGILSLLCGILSWVILTTALAIVAVAIGVFSLYKTRKETGKIAISAFAGIVIAVAAVLVSIVIR